MLQQIRERSQGWLAWILAIGLSLLFGLWGIQYYLNRGAKTGLAAKVNGDFITRAEVATVYDHLRREYLLQSSNTGSKIDPALNTRLKQAALQQLIQFHVLNRAAQKEGFRVSPILLSESIRNLPAFQENGQFSNQKFQYVLSRIGYSETDFLNEQEATLLINQIQAGIVGSNFIVPQEVNGLLGLLEQQRDIQYVIIPKQRFINAVQLLPNAEKQYFEHHPELFKTPEQVSIDYIELSLDNLLATEKATHPQLSEILAKQNAEKQFAQLSTRLADLAYSNSDSLQPVATELNIMIKHSKLFTRDQKIDNDPLLNNKTIQTAFSNDVLEHHYNSDVIQLAPGRVIVLRVSQHIPSAIKSFEEVQASIHNDLSTAEASKLAEKSGTQLCATLKLHPNDMSVLTEANLKPDTKLKLQRNTPFAYQKAFRPTLHCRHKLT